MHVYPENAPGVLPVVAGALPRRANILCRLQALALWTGRWLAYFLLASLAVTLFFRWAPLPFSSLMLQRQFAAQLRTDSQRLHYHWVGLERISPQALLAVIAAEDQKFLDHHGFDFAALAKAWQDNQKRKNPRGASTISQQVAKNVYLWPGKSLFRKGVEAYFTVLLEALWPKGRILEVYLNVAEFGPGVFGIEAASQTYFHKPAAKLNAAEAAILAAVLPSPLRSSAGRPSPYISGRAWQIQKQMRQLGGTALLRPILP
jgi:monofunctional glycosyltransferase